MPKIPATPEAITATRERILKEALFIINEEGYTNLSMRKLARRLGFTAKTIYNYYSNKDELYLMVLIKGFSDLAEEFRKADRSSADPLKKFRAAVHAYVKWGIENKHYYNIMFSMDTPKYSDYRGTAMEPVAERQNRVALEIPEIAVSILNAVAEKTGRFPARETPFHLLQIWSTLHGMVSLYISRVTLEVRNIDKAIDWILDEVVKSYT
ncbi:MAG TPA: TetR/AcrR family transcriptional regulator [Desulfomonilia bacterium]|jgi:AcrR family transcriptional regulator